MPVGGQHGATKFEGTRSLDAPFVVRTYWDQWPSWTLLTSTHTNKLPQLHTPETPRALPCLGFKSGGRVMHTYRIDSDHSALTHSGLAATGAANAATKGRGRAKHTLPAMQPGRTSFNVRDVKRPQTTLLPANASTVASAKGLPVHNVRLHGGAALCVPVSASQWALFSSAALTPC